MSPSAQLTSEQLKVIIEDEKKTDQGARVVQVQVDGEEDLHPENTSSVFNTVFNTINNEFQHECLEEVVRLLNAHPIHQSIHCSRPQVFNYRPATNDISGAPGLGYLVHCEEMGFGC